MELQLLNSELQEIGIIDVFQSLIWTDRFNKYGDFEVLASPLSPFASVLSQTAYVKLKESKHLMMLEIFNLVSDSAKGLQLYLKGRSLEAILDWRVFWHPMGIIDNFQTGIEWVLNENVIIPYDTNRQIPEIEFLASTDPAITSLNMAGQFIDQTLYVAISELCESAGIGFKVTPTITGKFRFELYAGKDRSYSQSVNPHVVFSPNFDNLVNAEYVESKQFLRTAALIAGEKGVGNMRTLLWVDHPAGAGTGLSRRELYVDAGDIVRNTPDGELTEQQYISQLQGRALDKLAENTVVQAFSGQAETEATFKFEEDFFMGDILQIADEFGNSAKSRVTEMTYSQNSSGTKMYPTFSAI